MNTLHRANVTKYESQNDTAHECGAPAAPTRNEHTREGLLRSLALALAIAGVAALTLCLLLLPYDQTLSEAIRKGHLAGDVRKLVNLSEAFAHGSGAAVILLAVFLGSRRPKAAIWVAVVMTLVSGGVANVLKASIPRARPYTFDSSPLAGAGENGWMNAGSSYVDARERSFPSGHTATAWGLAIGLCLLFPRASVIFIALALLSSLQRVTSGAHFPTDTLVGFAVASLGCAGILAWQPVRSALLAEPAQSANGDQSLSS